MGLLFCAVVNLILASCPGIRPCAAHFYKPNSNKKYKNDTDDLASIILIEPFVAFALCVSCVPFALRFSSFYLCFFRFNPYYIRFSHFSE